MGSQDALFDVPAGETRREPRSATSKWGGRRSTNARAKCRLMLPHACRKCGGMITAEDPESSWHAGHREDRAAGGTDDGIEPEHAKCNTSEGGKLGAAITNARRAPQPQHITRERTPQWW